MIRFIPGLFLILAGCSPGPEPLTPQDAAETTQRRASPDVIAGPTEVVPPPDALRAEDHITADTPDLARGPTPASAGTLAELLQARHTEDLPSRETLDAHADPAEALVWLSLHGDSAAVRIRATHALGAYPEAERADHLASLFLADDTHPALRAAALTALASYDAPTRARFSGILRNLTEHSDPRVARAATQAVEGLAP